MWRILASILFAVILIAGPVRAAPLPGRYVTAEKAFNALPLDERIRLQLWLTAAGYWLKAPGSVADEKLLDAIEQFQKSLGNKPTGVLSREEVDRLRQAAAPMLSYWGFQKFIEPWRGYQVWVPMGLGLRLDYYEGSLAFEAVNNKGRVEFYHFPEVNFADHCRGMERTKRESGWNIMEYLSEDVDCVIVARLNSDTMFYMMWDDPKGMMAVRGRFRAMDERFHLERLLPLMQASLWWAEFDSILPPQPDGPAATARPGTVQSAPDRRYFDEAKRAFEALDTESRKLAFVLLIAAGYDVLPTDRFTDDLFAAIGRFQAVSGLPSTGILRGAERERLVAVAFPRLALWKLNEVGFPGSAAHMWFPLGLGGMYKDGEFRWVFEGDENSLEVRVSKTVGGSIEKESGLIGEGFVREKYNISHNDVTDGNFYIYGRKQDRVARFWGATDHDGIVTASFSYIEGKNADHLNSLLSVMVESLLASLPRASPLPMPTDEALERFKSATPGQASSPVAEGAPKSADK